ncbi:MAG: hypothetical protein H6706_11870 [Myxococcales bacterium]|nr:hypothetical protein [Myxococcales bacterium]
MKPLAPLALLAALAGPAAAQVEWAGDATAGTLITHARSYTLVVVTPGVDGAPTTDEALLVQRLRPTLSLQAGDALAAEVAWDVVPLIGTATAGAAFALAPENPLRIKDFDATLHAGTGWRLQHALDRLVVRYTTPWLEVRAGRQAIGHGSARLFPATDVFAPASPAAIDTEFKRGVDALRVTLPLGESQEVEAFAVVDGERPADGVYLGRWRATLTGWDASVLAGMTAAAPTVALDASGDVGGAGWYGEGLLRVDGDGALGRATVGLDTQLTPGLRLLGELHYNGSGELDPADYLRALTGDALARGETFLLGPAYLGVAAFYELTPTVALQGSWLQSLTDGSALAAPALSWDFAADVALSLGGLVPVGPRPEGGFVPRLQSEFGSYPYLVYTDVRLAL